MTMEYVALALFAIVIVAMMLPTSRTSTAAVVAPAGTMPVAPPVSPAAG
ncbi:MAG: hypothetical protein M3P94_07060 [Chloroflexota bacterium]|nr:hypothetical protein [Chloroflexia bacterium]MDQ3168391.1 hypothetical protein [Chloroflexota bacterium]MDQ3512550.1 hypothetical protein [Chloroflexota bacterium]